MLALTELRFANQKDSLKTASNTYIYYYSATAICIGYGAHLLTATMDSGENYMSNLNIYWPSKKHKVNEIGLGATQYYQFDGDIFVNKTDLSWMRFELEILYSNEHINYLSASSTELNCNYLVDRLSVVTSRGRWLRLGLDQKMYPFYFGNRFGFKIPEVIALGSPWLNNSHTRAVVASDDD